MEQWSSKRSRLFFQIGYEGSNLPYKLGLEKSNIRGAKFSLGSFDYLFSFVRTFPNRAGDLKIWILPLFGLKVVPSFDLQQTPESVKHPWHKLAARLKILRGFEEQSKVDHYA